MELRDQVGVSIFMDRLSFPQTVYRGIRHRNRDMTDHADGEPE